VPSVTFQSPASLQAQESNRRAALIEQNDLHSLADHLRANPRLRVFANHNDFLTSDEDVAWLTALIGPDHVSVFPRGGHLGNLHRPEVQAQLMSALDDLRSDVGAP
jgi:hypothetical protein